MTYLTSKSREMALKSSLYFNSGGLGRALGKHPGLTSKEPLHQEPRVNFWRKTSIFQKMPTFLENFRPSSWTQVHTCLNHPCLLTSTAQQRTKIVGIFSQSECLLKKMLRVSCLKIVGGGNGPTCPLCRRLCLFNLVKNNNVWFILFTAQIRTRELW